VGPLDLVRKIVELGAGLRKRQAEGVSASAVDAAMRAIDATTAMARHLRSGPLPPARGLERLALTGAAAQLRIVAGVLGVADARTAEPPPAEATAATGEERTGRDLGFVSPAERSLVREEKEARMRAALGALVTETLALVDEVLATPPELGGSPALRLEHRGRNGNENAR
jgi:hypothetical protein